MAFPTRPRSCACRRLAVRESELRRDSAPAPGCSGSPLIALGGCDDLGALEVLALEIAHERRGRQGPPRRLLQKLVHGDLGPDAVDVLAQPPEEPGELPARDLLVEMRDLGAQALVELYGDDGAERIGGEVPERAHGPVDVLQAALVVAAG